MSPAADDPFFAAFYALQISGFALLTFIVSVAYFSHLRRQETWYSFCLSWAVYAFSFSLLVFLPRSRRSDPPFGLCVAQGALVAAAAPLAGTSTAIMVLQLLLDVLAALPTYPHRANKSRLLLALLIFLPWFCWSVLIAVTLILAIVTGHIELGQNGAYCTSAADAIPKITAIWASVTAVIAVVIQVAAAVLLIRHRKTLLGVRRIVSMVIRVSLFAGCGIVCIVIQFDIMLAAIAPAAALIFGTQAVRIPPPNAYPKPHDISPLGSSSSLPIPEKTPLVRLQ
ncbi:hypothetical protein AX16_004461 [Volvariella volvacea WC 439]|nr:hypothetical protein AX16_004461 [Volvariella volvacea WC 439]